VSAVTEIRKADPTMPRPALLRAGLRVGRDHIASTVNTLFLAYAGASMPLLVLFALSNQSLGTIANSEVVATEIIRTLLGSIGLVAAVPITTWLATLLDPSEAGRRHK
ncbi:MAG: YibE/F family protein, partial [Acidimicrobiia bacterium]|nr:YibE/F family protein [Acidimicrobiia bacterium]